MFIDILERNLANNSFWSEMNRLHNEMNSVGRREFPPVNYYLDGDNVHVFVMLPGFQQDDIEISLEGKRLEVSGKKENSYSEYRTFNNESFFGEFKRALELPFIADADKVTAAFDNGLLKIILPKAESEKLKKIKIS